MVSKAVIEEYIKNLLGLEEKVINIEGQMTFNALSTHLTVIKSFYHWLEDEHRVTANPATYSSKRTQQSPLIDKKLLYGQVWQFDIEETVLSRVTYLRKRNHLKWYSKSEIQSICNELHSLRNETIFVISIETGMRIGEILGLKVNHFDPFELSLEVVKQQNIENKAQAKTTERTLFIPTSLSEMIQTYISTERAEANN